MSGDVAPGPALKQDVVRVDDFTVNRSRFIEEDER
jgi:hypothetical protein